MPNIICRTCGKNDFEDWGELASHILDCCKVKSDPHNKDRAGKMWAKRYIHRNAINKLKKIEKDFPYRTPLTARQKMAKEDTRRELSGLTVTAPTICPRCNQGDRRKVEKEHAEEPQAWKRNNCFMILCSGCR